MTAVAFSLFPLVLSFSLIESATSMIEASEWVAVSPELNRILDTIYANPTLKILAGSSYALNSGPSSFEEFVGGFRENCGGPMENYTREHNVTSETACVWNFLQEASQDSAFAFGIPFDREAFPNCGTWLAKGENSLSRFIIGMWAIYENKAEILKKTNTDDCETPRV